MQKKRVRKIISFALAIAIVASNTGMIPAVKGITPAFGIEASAEALDPLTGSCGATENDNVTYTLTDSDKDDEYDTLTISGTGAMADYTGSDPAWLDYSKNIRTISISEGVTSIGNHAFYGCSALKSVTFAENSALETIRESAFSFCTALESVTFAENSVLETIEKGAFFKCEALGSIEIPASVKTIGENAFSSCKLLGSIEIPASVNTIGDGAFYNCSALASATFAEDSVLETIGLNVFNSCASLESIALPASVKTIGSSAFFNCSSLASVTFAEDSELETIGDNVFKFCTSLESIALPASVETIGGSTFFECSSLSSVTFAKDSELETIGDNAFKSCTSLESIELPASVRTLGSCTFSSCDSLESVSFMEVSALERVETDTFKACTNLKKFIFGGSYTMLGKVINGFAVQPEGCEIVFTIVGLEDRTGSCGVSEADDVTWTLSDRDEDRKYETLTISGTGAMADYPYGNAPWNDHRTDINTLVISEGVTGIGKRAFYCCEKITEVTVPASLTKIGEEAFSNCSALKTVTLKDDSALKEIGSKAFFYCSALESINSDKAAGLESIGIYAFRYCSALKAITVPASVTSIGENTFYKCSALESVTFAENSALETIGEEAFTDCEKLASIEIPASVTEIGNYAFSGCGRLEAVTIEDSSKLESIGDFAFHCCGSLKSIAVPAGVKTIGEEAFYSCSSLGAVTFGSGSKLGEISNSAFNGCMALTSITVPASVTMIGNGAFSGCLSLETVDIEEGSVLTKIDKYAFSVNPKLKTFTVPASVTVIDDIAFGACTSLETVTFEQNSALGKLGSDVFDDCYSLKNIYYYGSKASWDAVEGLSGAAISQDCTIHLVAKSLTGSCGATDEDNVTFTLTDTDKDGEYDTLTISGEGAMADYSDSSPAWYDYRETINTVSISEGVTSIGSYAFLNCSALQSIEIPASVKTIRKSAFNGCSALASVTFAENSVLETIGEHAFDGCKSLKSIELPESVKTIEYEAFQYCTALSDVTFAENSVLETIGNYAFLNCPALSSIEISASVKTIGEGAFSCCSALASVTFAENSVLERIGEGAFCNCSALASVTFMGTSALDTIGKDAFNGCNKLSNMYYFGTQEQWKAVSVGDMAIPEECTVHFVVPFGAPTVTATAGVNSVELSWDEVYSATRYAVLLIDGDTKTPLSNVVMSERYTVSDLEAGKTYYFTVMAFNGRNWSAPSEAVPAVPKAPPTFGAPEEVKAAGGDNSVTLTWNEVPDAVKYAVTLIDGETKTVLSNKITSTEYTVSGLEAGKTYTFTVMAFNGKKWSAASEEVTAQPYTTVPAVEAAEGDRSVTLTWNEVPGAVKYAVTLIDGETKTVLSSKITSTEYTISDLEAGKTYYFTVMAFNGRKWSAASEEVSAQPYTTVPAVEAAAGDRCVTLTWNEVPGAVKYAVTLIDGETKTVLSSKVTSAKYIHKGIEANKTYTYAVRSFNGKKWSAASEKVTAVPYSSVPVVEAVSGDRSVTLTWNEVPGAVKYAVTLIDGETKTVLSSKVTSAKFVHKGLEANKIYTYVVQAFNGKKWSAASEKVYAMPYSTVPVVSAGSNFNSVYIWWDPVPGATKYAVSEKIGETLKLISNKIISTEFTLENVEDPESHVYVVQSYNGKKWSAASEPAVPYQMQ